MTPLILILPAIIGLIGSYVYVGLKKPITGNLIKFVSTALLLGTTIWSAVVGNSGVGPLIALSLVFVGDCCLGLNVLFGSKYPNNPLFIIGMAIFGLSYTILAYTILATFAIVVNYFVFAIVFMILITFGFWQIKFYDIERTGVLTIEPLVYMTILTCMVALTITTGNAVLMIGAILLYICDITIGQDKYNTKFFLTFEQSEYVLIGSYYAGFGLVLSQLCF